MGVHIPSLKHSKKEMEYPVPAKGIPAVQPIHLEIWRPNLDLSRPPVHGAAERFWLPDVARNARAFRFEPPPPILAPDTIAVFRPASLRRLVRDQVVLVQFRLRAASKDLPRGVGHLGRVIAGRRDGALVRLLEPAAANLPAIELDERKLELVMACVFRGRYCPP